MFPVIHCCAGGGVTAVCDFYHTVVGCHAAAKIGSQDLGAEEQVGRIPIKVYGWIGITVVSASLYVTLLRKLAATHCKKRTESIEFLFFFWTDVRLTD